MTGIIRSERWRTDYCVRIFGVDVRAGDRVRLGRRRAPTSWILLSRVKAAIVEAIEMRLRK